MNGTHADIQIFKPFGEAFELMKTILFQPFDLSKWCVIGFAALLAGHFAGGGGFSPPLPFGKNRHFPHLPGHGTGDLPQNWPWLAGAIALLVLVALVLILVLGWLRARGIFIFTDCIVHNHAAIKKPWREYRREGNSYFLFSLAAMFVCLAIVGVGVGIGVLLFSMIHIPQEARTVVFITLGVLFLFAWICLMFIFALINYFMPVVMYIRRCRALDAFREVLRLIRTHAASFLLFALFGMVLFLALIVASTMVNCATCCCASLPYVGTVIMLPAFVWLRGFGFFYFRQFGPEYDVWSGQLPPGPKSPPPLPA